MRVSLIKAKDYSKDFIFYLGASIVPMVITVSINPWIAMNMSPEDYAISGYFLSYNSLISPLIGLYLIHFYTKEFFLIAPEEREKLYAKIFKGLIWMSMIMTLICFGSLYIYLTYFHKNMEFQAMPYLALSVFAIPLGLLFSLKITRFRLERKPLKVFYSSVASSIIGTIIVLLLVVILKMGALGKLLAPFISSGLICGYIIFTSLDVFRISTPMCEYCSMVVFCIPLVAGCMMEYFCTGFSTTYLESIGDVTEYGKYVVGASIAGIVIGVTSTINNLFHPDILQAIAAHRRATLLSLVALEISIIAIIIIAMIVVAPFLVDILTAGRYVDSVPYFRIISIGAISSSIYYILNDFSILRGHKYHYIISTVIGSAVIVALMPIAVDKAGFTGGAWVRAASYLIFAAINLILILTPRGLGLIRV